MIGTDPSDFGSTYPVDPNSSTSGEVPLEELENRLASTMMGTRACNWSLKSAIFAKSRRMERESGGTSRNAASQQEIGREQVSGVRRHSGPTTYPFHPRLPLYLPTLGAGNVLAIAPHVKLPVPVVNGSARRISLAAKVKTRRLMAGYQVALSTLQARQCLRWLDVQLALAPRPPKSMAMSLGGIGGATRLGFVCVEGVRPCSRLLFFFDG